ncbi:MAG: O-antigen ligase family protein [Caldilineales bacterium]|nr:O-antigen ligase family protein [Caldilineales bacterium]MCW5860774.1 O-antigen ligase family protein [Caldilineales bacterium]
MLSTTYLRVQSLLIDPDPRRQRRAILGLLAASGLLIGLLVGLAGPFIAAGLAIALIGVWLVVRSPLWGLVGVIAISAILPFATLPFKIGFTPSFLDLAVFATFAVWAFKYVTREETRFEASAIGPAVTLFLAMAVITFALGLQYARPTANNLRQFLEMVISITLFFVAINTVRTRAQLIFLARALMIGGAVAAALGVIFYLIPRETTVWVLNQLARLGYPGGSGALRFVNDDPDGLMRAIGTSIDPNVLGGMMILAGAFTLPQFFSAQPILPRRWITLMLALEVSCLYFTISRGSMLGFVLAAGVVGALRHRRLLLLLFIGGVLFFVLPFTQDYVQNLLAGLAGQDRSTQMRFGEYRDAFALISRYPLFGVGFTGTPEIGLYIGVSSLYLLMAETMGLVGVVIFLAVMLLFLNALSQGLRRRPTPWLESLLLGVLAAMIGLLAAGVLDHYLFNLTYPHMTSLLWLLVGLGMAAVRQTE